MKYKHLKHIIIFSCFIISIDLLIGFIGKQYFEDISFGFYGNINNSIKSESDLLILGSSRAMHHYNTDLISQDTGLKCYNAGTGGYGLFLDYAVLSEKINQKKAPKTIILDLSPNTMVIGANSYAKLDRLLPYYNKYSSFREIIVMNPAYSKMQQVFNLYKYNSTLYDFMNSYIEKNKVTHGYEPIEGELNIKNFSPFFLEEDHFFDEKKIKFLNKIIDLCKINNINLIGVVSPSFLKYDTKNRIINKLDAVFKESDFNFYDYSDFSDVYQDPSYFKDQIHMNSLGADRFSKEIVSKIKS